MYTLDTNAIIYYIKDDSKAVAVLKDFFLQSVPIYVSAITEVELFSFSNLSRSELEQIEKILATVALIPLDSRLARIAGSLRSQYNLKIADGIIAATALFTGTTLVSRNIRDFRKISGISLQTI